MRFLILILLFMLTLHAGESYELQLYASKTNDTKGIQRMLTKSNYAGLGCYISKENRSDGVYTFVRCDKTTNYKNMTQSIQKAKKAGLDYYLLKSDNSRQKDFRAAVSSLSTVVKTDNLSQLLFGHNEELMQILHNKNSISKSDLEKRKAIYLKSIASSEKFNGLYLKGDGSNNFDIRRRAYNLRLQWNIFDEGYLESKKDVQKILLKKELEYERIMDEYRRSNLELSLYKMHAISNYINYHFLRAQEKMLFSMTRRAKKKYDASLITSSLFFKRKKAYEHIKHRLSYYETVEKEPYDERLKPLMHSIENINIADKKGLSQYAYSNSFELKNSKNKIALSGIDDNWIDRLKTNVYVEQKKNAYLNDSGPVVGFQVQVPLDFDNNDEYKKIEIEANRLKAHSLKSVITKNIDDIYHKIAYHKNYIKTLKSDIAFFNNEAKTVQLKAEYPLEKQTHDLEHEREMLNLTISKHHQEIWQERTEILKLLLKLQNISGVQILA